MSTDKQDTRRKQILLANLIILTLIIFGLIFVIAAYPTFIAPDPTSTPTITKPLAPTRTPTKTPTITLTPTITPTPRPTFTPTITQTPTRTLTPEPSLTPVGPPTLTAAWPVNNNLIYELPNWTAGKAHDLITLIDNYPNTLDLGQRGEDNTYYYEAFEYPAIAQDEGLLRFPDSAQAIDWRWGLAHNLALSGDASAGDVYADLLVSALNRGETTLPNLKKWFSQFEPDMDFFIVEMKPISGYIGSYLVEVRGDGAAFIWLLESSSGFSASTLETHFDYINRITGSWNIGELSGDTSDGEEAAFYFSNKPKDFQVQPPAVLNLGDKPATALPNVPDEDIFNIGMEFNNYWAVGSNENGQNTLVFESTVFPLCPVTLRREYIWNGDVFIFYSGEYKVTPQLELLHLCEFIVDHAEDFWGPDAASQVVESLLPDWPPAQDENGKAYPLDAVDEWRYKLGINYALTGESKKSKDYLAEIVSNPSVPNSRWITPAQEFLEIYKLPDDVYRACVHAADCDPSYALSYLVDHLPAEELPNIFQHLQDWGINIHSSGFFDFEEDAQAERWFTLRHRPVEKLEFWMLGVYPDGAKALKIGTVDANPPAVEFLDEAFVGERYITKKPVVLVDGTISFSMLRKPGSHEPYIEFIPLRKEFPNHFEVGLQEAEHRLFAGVDPAKVHKELKDLQIWPGLLCESTWSCDRYYYMLGLASELSGHERDAVDAYLVLWRDYSKSPFTIMARLKLEGPGTQLTITPIYTPTATVFFSTPGTATATPSLTPTITGTISPTSTPSPTSSTSVPYP